MLEKTFYKQFLSRSFDIPVKVTYWDNSEEVYGDGEPKVSIKINEIIPIKDITNSATLALGEAYMDGKIEIEGSIQTLVASAYKTSNGFMNNSKFSKFIPKQIHTEKASKKDISYHYDIGNDFYKLWLDATMTYSCAYFQNENDTLEEAQINKVHHILKKLNPTPNKTLLDIGCGWGTLILTAARDYGLKSTGITLSQEQYNYVNKKISEYNLEDKVKVKLIDYRDIKNQKFDYITSVGMFEHVGKENLDIYFKKVQELLHADGIALIHGITGQHFGKGVDTWITKHIFPGGYIPNVAENLTHILNAKLQVSDIEPLRRHYQRTLEIWSENFNKCNDEVKEMFDERFIRMWNLYLQGCAASFESGNIDVIQFLLSNGASSKSLPITREYIYSSENITNLNFKKNK